jgi:hypothetical protein
LLERLVWRSFIGVGLLEFIAEIVIDLLEALAMAGAVTERGGPLPSSSAIAPMMTTMAWPKGPAYRSIRGS